jgi:transcription elongation factor GreA
MLSHNQVPVTQKGYEKLKEKLKHLKSVERPQVIKEISQARALGDLSENAEYHAARDKQSFIEGQISELESKLGNAQIIDISKGKADKIVFGVTVELLDVTDESKNEKKTYKIVGDLEADIKLNAISISSPLAKSLINKKVGDLVTVSLPKGEKYYEIKKIEFK